MAGLRHRLPGRLRAWWLQAAEPRAPVPGPLGRTLREKALWLLLAIGCLFFHRLLFLGETLYFRDLYLFFLPEKQLFADLIRAGEWPLWNPYLQGGLPYLADVSNATLYPSNLLYLLLPPLVALNLDLVLHVLFALGAAYLLARTLDLEPAAAVLVGVIYGFCGVTLSLVNVYGKLLAMPYLPLLLLCWHRFLRMGDLRWFVGAVLCAVLQFMAGAPEVFVLTLLLALTWTVFHPGLGGSLLGRGMRFLALAGFVAGLCAVQALPLLEMTGQSPRGEGISYASFSTWSLHPKRLPELVVPGFSGRTDTLVEEEYWGHGLVDQGYPFLLSVYFGLVTVVLALAGVFSRREDESIPRPVRFLLGVVLALSVLLACGRFLPFFELLHRYLPLVGLFRYPVKFLLGAVLPLALLAGYASQRHFGDPPPPTRPRPVWWIWAVAAALTATWALTTGGAFDPVLESFFAQSSLAVRSGVGRALAHACALWCLAALVFQHRRLRPTAWQPWLLVLVVAIDLTLAGRPLNPSASKEVLETVPPIVATVRGEIGAGRLYRAPNPDTLSLLPPSDDSVWRYRWNLEVLNLYLAPYYGIPLIFNADHNGLVSKRLVVLKQVMESLPWERRLPLLSAGAVTLVLTPGELSVPGLERLTRIDNSSSVAFYLYRNLEVAPPVGFVTIWHAAPSESEALRAMTHPDFDPRIHAVLEGDQVEAPSPPCDPRLELVSLEDGPHRTRHRVTTAWPGYLVFSSPYYPGWRYYVAGRRSPALRANSAFSAVYLAAGVHEVERRFVPLSLYVGASISGACLLLLVGAGVWWRIRRAP